MLLFQSPYLHHWGGSNVSLWCTFPLDRVCEWPASYGIVPGLSGTAIFVHITCCNFRSTRQISALPLNKLQVGRPFTDGIEPDRIHEHSVEQLWDWVHGKDTHQFTQFQILYWYGHCSSHNRVSKSHWQSAIHIINDKTWHCLYCKCFCL